MMDYDDLALTLLTVRWLAVWVVVAILLVGVLIGWCARWLL